MRALTINLSLIVCLSLGACDQRQSAEVGDNQITSDPVSVDLVMTGGKVLTVDENFSIHSALVVDEGLIVATGDNSLAEHYRGEVVIDLQGKLLMPGFNDSHTHIRGRPLRFIELGKVTSIAEMQTLIRDKVDQLGEG